MKQSETEGLREIFDISSSNSVDVSSSDLDDAGYVSSGGGGWLFASLRSCDGYGINGFLFTVDSMGCRVICAPSQKCVVVINMQL